MNIVVCAARSLYILLLLPGLSSAQSLKLWYKQPAQNWNEALPVGNGRLGAMVFGKVDEELLQLNESTLWSGGPVKPNPNPDARPYLAQIRKALDGEDYDLAATLSKKMQGFYTESYQPLADLLIRQSVTGQPTAYYRDLDINNALTTTQFTVAGITYTREVFVSVPDQAIVLRLTADQAGKLNFVATVRSQLRYKMSAVDNRELALTGKAPTHVEPSYMRNDVNPVIYADTSGCRGMRFALRMRVLSGNGTITTDTAGLHVSNATEIVLLSGATSFNGFDKCPDKDGRNETALAQIYLNEAAHKSYKALKQAHISDYRNAGGTYANLFCTHPPFQIDGNFGGVSGMGEMLLQSHLSEVWLLPALLDAWSSGQVSGLGARGGFEIMSMDWQGGTISKLVIRSTLGGNCRIRVPNALKASGGPALTRASGTNPNPFFQSMPVVGTQPTQVYDFPTKAGAVYTFAK